MDEWMSVRANERTKAAAKVATANEEKKKKRHATVSGVRFSALVPLRDSASVVLVPTIGWS